MVWLSFLFILHLSTKGFALNDCERCKCCKSGATRCQDFKSILDMVFSDYCEDGCIDGFYDNDCRQACSDNCLICDGFSCNMCSNGYYGTDCGKCRDNCLTCSSLDNCYSCKNGFYNGRSHGNSYSYHLDCRSQCQHNCRSCTSYDTCTECVEGKYNGIYSDCRESCNSACKACTSYDNCTACPAGKYGLSCQNNCGVGCHNHQCDIKNGSCACISSFQGDKCDQCINGKYGSNCDIPCPTGCANNLCKANGECYSCKTGFSGGKGSNCDQCVDGKFGIQCNMTCSTTCLPDEEGRTCFYTNGSCTKDCLIGYYGDMCKNRCSENCINIFCSRTSGACKFGCVSGFEGKNCTKSNSGVMADSGNTTDSSNIGVIIGACVGSVAATILVGGIAIIIRRCIRLGQLRRHTPERTYELTDVQQENVRAMQEPPNIERAEDSAYSVITVPEYEQLKVRNKNADTYARIEGTNVS